MTIMTFLLTAAKEQISQRSSATAGAMRGQAAMQAL